MKQEFSLFLLCVALVLLVGTVVSCVCAVRVLPSYVESYYESHQGASGSEILPLVLLLGEICALFIVMPVIGFVASGACMKLLEWKILRTVSAVFMWLFVFLGVTTAFFVYIASGYDQNGPYGILRIALVIGVVLSTIGIKLMKWKNLKIISIVYAVLIVLFLLMTFVLNPFSGGHPWPGRFLSAFSVVTVAGIVLSAIGIKFMKWKKWNPMLIVYVMPPLLTEIVLLCV